MERPVSREDHSAPTVGMDARAQPNERDVFCKSEPMAANPLRQDGGKTVPGDQYRSQRIVVDNEALKNALKGLGKTRRSESAPSAKPHAQIYTTKMRVQEAQVENDSDVVFGAVEILQNMDEVRRKALEIARKCSREATEIYPYLRISGDRVARDKELLVSLGITHILNLAGSVCRNYHQDSNLFEYLQLNIKDVPEETIIPFLKKAMVFIEKARESNGKCFVHCHMGVSRSCTTIIAFVMMNEGLTFRQAFDRVKTLRPVAAPNAGFLLQLEQWETMLGQPGFIDTLKPPAVSAEEPPRPGS